MKRFNKGGALLRAVGVLTAIGIIVGGVTFAALQSQQDTLTGNTIETATANLQLSLDSLSYANSRPGFDFRGLVPGGSAQPTNGYDLYLRNSGDAALALKLAVSSVPTNPANVDLSKVSIVLTTVSSNSAVQSFSLQALMSAAGSGGMSIDSGNLPIGTVQHYKFQVSMAADAIVGSSASLGNIDFAISGLAQSS